jgi:hypothetical protein
MTTSQEPTSKNTVEAKTANGGSTENQLPEGVTEAPRNQEEMDLKHIRKWPKAVKTYLQVSDDKGKVLGSKVLERKVKQFCDEYANTKAADIKDSAKIIEKAKDLATQYTLQINMVESGLSGTITKYRIRQGMVFNIMKDLVRKDSPSWIKWFKDNFDGREFRSVQDYMRLAGIPNIIRFAVFGKERLLQIMRQLSEADKQTEDPVDAFIKRNGVIFNPEEELDVQELRIETDIAINYEKLLNAGIKDISKDMIDALVRNGKEIESVHIRELKVAKDARQDLVERFEKYVASDGRVPPNMTPARKAEGFKNSTDKFLKAMENAITDQDYRGQVNAEIIASLKEKLQQLERLVTSN